MKKYAVFNYTDNIYASREEFRTKKAAQEFIDQFREKFRKVQGYYRDNRWNKVAPENIDLEIIPADFWPYR